MNTVYKVVSQYGKRLFSARVFLPGTIDSEDNADYHFERDVKMFAVEYKVGEIVWPIYPGTKLFAFSSYSAAQAFACLATDRIFRSETSEELTTCPRRGLGIFGRLKEFYEKTEDPLGPFGVAPNMTVFCKNIKLLELI